MVRNQCVTSAGISQQCGTSAEPVRNESYVDISGYWWWGWAVGIGWWVLAVGCWVLSAGAGDTGYIFAISAQPVRNQCGVCRLVRNQCVTSALSPTHQFFACDICKAFENVSNSSAQLSN